MFSKCKIFMHIFGDGLFICSTDAHQPGMKSLLFIILVLALAIPLFQPHTLEAIRGGEQTDPSSLSSLSIVRAMPKSGAQCSA